MNNRNKYIAGRLYRLYYILITATVLTISCKNEKNEEINSVAMSFARNFFNFKFDKAYSLCTEESKRWILFHASNITSRDLETLNASDNSLNLYISSTANLNDTSAVVVVNAENVLCTDYLEHTGNIIPEKEYYIPLVKRNGKWFVKMEGPLQSAK